ncbi:MAG: hypothetical protein SR1Q7_05445 [Quinella sp. 1Q7]|nr:hypothetical protein [Quinella sp. 1Q7]
MRYPTHLQHKPIIGVDDYDLVDGMYAGHSDAKALSIGRAQYDENHISAKIWRHDGNWKRTSEEMPLHRVLDLAALIVSLYHPQNLPSPLNNYHQTHAAHLSPRIQTDAAGNDDMQTLYDYLVANDAHLRPRLKELKTLLDGLNI